MTLAIIALAAALYFSIHDTDQDIEMHCDCAAEESIEEPVEMSSTQHVE